jgi:hypothetical protein
MKAPSLPTARTLVRDVIIPMCGVAVIVVQLFLPGERLGLIAAGLSMMGLPFVAYGARAIDKRSQEGSGG